MEHQVIYLYTNGILQRTGDVLGQWNSILLSNNPVRKQHVLVATMTTTYITMMLITDHYRNIASTLIINCKLQLGMCMYRYPELVIVTHVT